MQRLSRRIHHCVSSIPAASLPVAVQSMLNATAFCLELRAPKQVTSCSFSRAAAWSRVARSESADCTGVLCSLRPTQPNHTDLLLHTPFTCRPHDIKLPHRLNSQAIRGSRSLMACASVEAPDTALVQEDVKLPTANQKADTSLDSILPQAESADQPFLGAPADQPARAWVDYSKGQRPLQVLHCAVGSSSLMTVQCMCVCDTGCQCNVSAVYFPRIGSALTAIGTCCLV